MHSPRIPPGHDVAVAMRNAPELAVRRVTAVERDAGDYDGLPSLRPRREAVDVVAVADPEQGFSTRVQSCCSSSTVWLQVGARASYEDGRAAALP